TFEQRSRQRGTHVLPGDFAAGREYEEHRALARQGGGVRGRQEIRYRCTPEWPSRARHEAIHLPDPKRQRLREGWCRVAFGAEAPQIRGQRKDGRRVARANPENHRLRREREEGEIRGR